LHVGYAVEEEDAADHLVGVPHLVDGFVVVVLPEPLVAPVLAHLRVHVVLVDARELGRQDSVQGLDHRRVAAPRGPPSPASPPLAAASSRRGWTVASPSASTFAASG